VIESDTVGANPSLKCQSIIGQEQACSSSGRAIIGSYLAVVDDDASVLELLQDMSRGYGFRVISFSHPDVLIRTSRQLTPAFFLIDLILRYLDGIELALHLRSTGYSQTPMIAMSGSRAMLGHARVSGFFDGALAKPFDLCELLAYIECYAGSPASTTVRPADSVSAEGADHALGYMRKSPMPTCL
jgi:DNA-binding response OmpR family regulator